MYRYVPDHTPTGRLRLGLPAWAFPGWRDRYFSARPSPLASYATVFDAVEGNTGFYGIPDPAAVAGWAETLAGRDFRFSFKLPRSVTHEAQPSVEDFHAFLQAMEPLRAHLGPMLVQFPATLDAAALQRRHRLFARLRERHEFVLEVRHPEFFAPGAARDTLDELLVRHGGGRVVLDAGALYAGDPAHPAVVHARHEKPLLPVPDLDGGAPRYVRLVLHPEFVDNADWIAAWAQRCCTWLGEGTDVTMTLHCPDNTRCPPFAREFHTVLSRVLVAAHGPAAALARLPDWPVPQQDALF